MKKDTYIEFLDDEEEHIYDSSNPDCLPLSKGDTIRLLVENRDKSKWDVKSIDSTYKVLNVTKSYHKSFLHDIREILFVTVTVKETSRN